MSDEDKAVYMSQSLASIASENDITLFTRMVKALNITKDDDTFKPITNYDFWKDDLSSIIDKMVDMCIDETELEESIEASKQLIANTFSWRDINITNDDIAKIIEYHTKLSEVIAAHARTNGEEKLKQALQMLTPLTAYRGGTATLPLYGIYKIASLYSKPSKYLEKECSAELLFMHDIAEKVCKSNDVRNMAELYIDTIFRMARQWQKEYREFKDQRGLYDYSDMLDKFYKLLQNEAVKKEIGGR
jgi:ATP-dependent exoDNAse (exonuclease V) beta subunit